jgi:hypothetical protein
MQQVLSVARLQHGASPAAVVDKLRGKMTSKREQQVARVFNSLDAGGAGRVRVTSLSSLYDPTACPDVVAGKASAKEALKTLVEQLVRPQPPNFSDVHSLCVLPCSRRCLRLF